MASMRLPRLRAFNPKQAMWIAVVSAAAFVLIATLVYHPYQSSHTAAVAAAPPRAAAVRPVAEMIRRPSGEADRAVADSNSPQRLVELWADAIRTRNLDAQIACYAPRVYAFYGLAHVTPEDIRRRRAAAMGRYNDVRQLEISNIEVRMESPTAATATFDERWDFIGRDPSSGKVQERLRMRKVDGEWRITSESNMKTYFKNGPNPQS